MNLISMVDSPSEMYLLLFLTHLLLVLPKRSSWNIIPCVMREWSKPQRVQGRKSWPKVHRELLPRAELRQQGHKKLKRCRSQKTWLLSSFVTYIVIVFRSKPNGSLLEATLHIVGYITSNMGIPLGFLGAKRYTFGTCIITSVGMLGYSHVFAPLPRTILRLNITLL